MFDTVQRAGRQGPPKSAVPRRRNVSAAAVAGTFQGFGNGLSSGARRGFKLGLATAAILFFAPVIPPLAALGLPQVGTGFEAIATGVILYGGGGGALIGLVGGGLFGLLTGGATAAAKTLQERRQIERMLSGGRPPAEFDDRDEPPPLLRQ